MLGRLLLEIVVGLLTPLLMLMALSSAPDISAGPPWPCSRSGSLGRMPSPVLGAAEACEARFLRAARLRIREMTPKVVRAMRKRSAMITPTFTAVFGAAFVDVPV